MRLVVDALQMLEADVGVALGGGEARMPQKLLDAPNVRPAAQQMGGEGMAKYVRANLATQAASPNLAIEMPSDAARGEPTSAMVEKKSPLLRPRPL